MADRPLMPLATAVWLIDNTSLTFDQIAEFCGLHPLQVKGIADGDVAVSVRGIDPITTHQLTREEIENGQADEAYRLKLSRPKTIVADKPRK
ncbi:MAG: cell cycle transcriptional regulator TrcR, partial [Hyphococcus sp.]